MSSTRIYWLHALSPTHLGTGRGVGYIDLPIDRDAVTGWPIVRGSAFKGVWADQLDATPEARANDTMLRAAFGVIGDDNNSNAGSLLSTDARLVCLPVRSFRGTFAWATSPLCLQMLHRTLELAGVPPESLPPAPPGLPDDVAHHPDGSALLEQERVYVEDLDFQGKPCPTSKRWAQLIAKAVFADDQSWREAFEKRFVVLPDTAFDFLCETGTEVHTRVRIDEATKTVAEGALWTEELLPAESILAGVVQCDRIFAANGEEITPQGLLEKYASGTITLQIGGNASIGCGIVRCTFTSPLTEATHEHANA